MVFVKVYHVSFVFIDMTRDAITCIDAGSVPNFFMPSLLIHVFFSTKSGDSVVQKHASWVEVNTCLISPQVCVVTFTNLS